MDRPANRLEAGGYEVSKTVVVHLGADDGMTSRSPSFAKAVAPTQYGEHTYS